MINSSFIGRKCILASSTLIFSLIFLILINPVESPRRIYASIDNLEIENLGNSMINVKIQSHFNNGYPSPIYEIIDWNRPDKIVTIKIFVKDLGMCTCAVTHFSHVITLPIPFEGLWLVICDDKEVEFEII